MAIIFIISQEMSFEILIDIELITWSSNEHRVLSAKFGNIKFKIEIA